MTIDDVIAALLDLLAQLQIDAPQLASRVSSVSESTIKPRRLYSHTGTIGELLTEWHQNPDYLDNIGNPAPIRLRGRGRSFAHLAAHAVPSMKASALLAELEGVGAVSIDSSGFVHVQMRSLSVYQDRQLAIDHTLMSLRSFIMTLRHNLGSDVLNSDQLFHRVAWNEAFAQDLIPNLKIKLKRQGQSFLESFDNWMIRKTKAHSPGTKKGKPVQVSIGVYLSVGERSRTKR